MRPRVAQTPGIMEVMEVIELGRHAPEASSILSVADPELLAACGHARAFWVCLDERPADRALAIVGCRSDDRGWEVREMPTTAPPNARTTEDSEAIARDEHGWLYLFGSHFGPKAGPVTPSRAFVARVRESQMREGKGGPPMELRRRPFLLHRKINDAFIAAAIDLLPLGPNMRERYIARTMRKGAKGDKKWHVHLRVEDWPINIEGALYVGDDTFLLGLRFPSTAAGEPLVARIRGLARAFETRDDAGIEVDIAARIRGISARARPLGIRGMSQRDGRLHLIVGSIGAERKPTAINIDYPESTRLDCSHVVTAMPGATGCADLSADPVHHFRGHPNVEGLAHDGEGGWVYVLDDDHTLRVLLAEPSNG